MYWLCTFFLVLQLLQLAYTFHPLHPQSTTNTQKMLKERYFERLGLPKEQPSSSSSSYITKPTIETLNEIVEAHVHHIPFENLSQHGAKGMASLKIEETAHKILERKRGGFCYELNGLLAELLMELGYKVQRLPAFVCGFDSPIPTHLALLVTILEEEEDDDKCNRDSTCYFVDVGFGEPAIHPLKYELNLEQTTPDGMVSRFVSSETTSSSSNKSHSLEMWDKQQQLWKPRLQWDDGLRGVPLQYFADALTIVQTSGIFCEKSITVKLTRTEKVSMAGNVLKRTGPPRFGQDMVVSRTVYETVDQVRQVLLDEFGISLEETVDLDLGESLEAPASLWADM